MIENYGNNNHWKNAKKMQFQCIPNKNLPWLHMILELDELGVAKNLIKYATHIYKNFFGKFWFKKIKNLPTACLNSETTKICFEEF